MGYLGITENYFSAISFQGKALWEERSGGGDLSSLVFSLEVGSVGFQTDRDKALILQWRTRTTEGREVPC